MGQHFTCTAPLTAKAAADAFSPLEQLTTRQGACLVANISAYTLGAGVPVREQKQLGKHLMAEPQRPKSSDSLSDVSDGVAEPIEEELFAQAAYLINYFAHRRGFQFLREVSPVAACYSGIGRGPLKKLHALLMRTALHSNRTGSGSEALCRERCPQLPALHPSIQAGALPPCLQVFRQRPKYSMQVLHDAMRILLEAGELATDRLFTMFARVSDSQTPHTASWWPQWHLCIRCPPGWLTVPAI